ncbi:MAG: dTDP-4-dehydrorhamnose reductase [Lysobacterales bacterium]
MNILLTGAAGQLGSELLPLLSAYGRVIPTDRSTPDRAVENWLELDIGDGGKLESLLNRVQPGLIVNTAAYTAVDQAETDIAAAFNVNADLPGRLASWAKKNGSRLVHYSTDYVFDGKADRPYLETDASSPMSVYGDSKRAGERALEESACSHVILRTSWVYSSHGKNFVLSMLDLARRGVSLKIVDDQQGCPTSAKNLALASVSVIQAWQTNESAEQNGVFHYCDGRSLSWYGFAQEIFSLAVSNGLLNELPEVAPIPSSEFPQPARRPKWSVLDTAKITRVFNIHPASFEQSLTTVINEIKSRA